jgi:DNA-binding NarL/FixJ family response regulator
MRVLLADDHPGILEVVRTLLKTDYDVVGCMDNGESLFEAAMKLQPDVIVTDISMPKLSGIDAVDRLRESGCPSKVVFLTVHSDADFVDAALKTGALAYVLKPSIASDLLFAIQEAFAGRAFVSNLG